MNAVVIEKCEIANLRMALSRLETNEYELIYNLFLKCQQGCAAMAHPAFDSTFEYIHQSLFYPL